MIVAVHCDKMNRKTWPQNFNKCPTANTRQWSERPNKDIQELKVPKNSNKGLTLQLTS